MHTASLIKSWTPSSTPEGPGGSSEQCHIILSRSLNPAVRGVIRLGSEAFPCTIEKMNEYEAF